MPEQKMFTNDQNFERVVIFAIETNNIDVEQNMIELTELIKTSGAEVVAAITQKLIHSNPKSYFGKGKLDELRDLVALHGATGVVCDDELSSNQLRTISNMLDAKVMDRTMVILDIFAKRAFSSEGRAQVELAQLKYSSSRLTGLGISLTRQGGGIGTRGPGEKKLEMDRRTIRNKILELEKDIEQIKIQRGTQREQRIKKGAIVVSTVGYTNAGKSTLMNYLTQANVLTEDKLFATLDTTTRKLKLPSTQEVLFTDTVGFIQKLPHTLIKAFNATLEELNHADILVHVVDVSNENYIKQIETVYETLEKLGCIDKIIITVLNKYDLIDKDVGVIYKDEKAFETIKISALTGDNIELLLNKIDEVILKTKEKLDLIIPFESASVVAMLHERAQVISEDYREDGIYVSVIINDELKSSLEKFTI